MFSIAVFLLVFFIILFNDGTPIFFKQQRVGLNGILFNIYKFRSMKINSEKFGTTTYKNDIRIFSGGRFLRKYKIDELPQLINVVLGDMSLVGPRPEQPQFVEQFQESIPRYMERHREKAGITGWAQVNGLRGDTSIEDRTRYDLWYVENWSLWLDFKIIIRTVFKVLSGTAY